MSNLSQDDPRNTNLPHTIVPLSVLVAFTGSEVGRRTQKLPPFLCKRAALVLLCTKDLDGLGVFLGNGAGLVPLAVLVSGLKDMFSVLFSPRLNVLSDILLGLNKSSLANGSVRISLVSFSSSTIIFFNSKTGDERIVWSAVAVGELGLENTLVLLEALCGDVATVKVNSYINYIISNNIKHRKIIILLFIFE